LDSSDSFRHSFAVNKSSNTKYNPFTFLPLVLYNQFKYFFNLYFLLVALSQFVPQLKIGFMSTYIAPLAFVLSVTIGKEAIDDWKRNRRDAEVNAALYDVLVVSEDREEGFELRKMPSSKLCVGDLVHLEKNQRVPADCVLLWTNDESGACFIRLVEFRRWCTLSSNIDL
jgi:phospholipid-translocating ATPase